MLCNFIEKLTILSFFHFLVFQITKRNFTFHLPVMIHILFSLCVLVQRQQRTDVGIPARFSHQNSLTTSGPCCGHQGCVCFLIHQGRQSSQSQGQNIWCSGSGTVKDIILLIKATIIEKTCWHTLPDLGEKVTPLPWFWAEPCCQKPCHKLPDLSKLMDGGGKESW